MTSNGSNAPSTLGEFLRQERERRGITIEQLASATKISVRLLHALESNQFSELPARPFIRGFVTSYARFLGLDPKELLTRYGDFIQAKSLERPNRESGLSGYAFERKEGDQSRTGLWILVGSMAVIGAVVMLVFKPSFRHHRKSHLEKLKASHSEGVGAGSPQGLPTVAGEPPLGDSSPASTPSPAPSLVPAASPTPVASPTAIPSVSPAPSTPPKTTPTATPSPSPKSTPSPSPSSSPSPSASPSASPASVTQEAGRKPDPLNAGKDLLKSEIRHKVVVRALEDLWVRYRVDEKPIGKIVMRKDMVFVIFAKDQIALQVSNPKAASFTASSSVQPGGNQLLVKKAKMDEYLAEGGESRQSLGTAIFPAEKAKSLGEIFAKEKPLGSPPAPWRQASPTPNP